MHMERKNDRTNKNLLLEIREKKKRTSTQSTAPKIERFYFSPDDWFSSAQPLPL